MSPSPRFEEGLILAARLHAEQVRKGTTIPYLAHLLGVASLVLEHGGGEDEAIAALLHDAVEDQGGRPMLEAIRRRFGSTAADIVDGCTDPRPAPNRPGGSARRDTLLISAGRPPRSVWSRLPTSSTTLARPLECIAPLCVLCALCGELLSSSFRIAVRRPLLHHHRYSFRSAGATLLVEELDRVVSAVERLASAPNASVG